MTEPARPGLLEPLLSFAGATAIAALLFWTGQVVPFVRANLHGGIAVVFLYAPWLAGRLSRRGFDSVAAGLRLGEVGLGLRVLGAAILATWPIFLAGFLLFYGNVCTGHAPLLQYWVETFAPICPRWLGWSGAHLRLPDEFALLALSQLLVVALPEELFFRGYLMGRFEERWPSTRTVAGARVGWPLVASSALFALGHVAVDLDIARAAVFFPALVFGWMRARTGALAAGAIFHVLCNLLSEVLHLSFFR